MPLQDAAKIQAANATLEVEFSAIRRLCEVLETLTPTQRSGGDVELGGDLGDGKE